MFKDKPEFAPEYPRSPEGWVLFPSDQQYRKQIFPEGVSGHVAKANVFLVQAIVEYVSKPGQLLLDPMAGTCTLMVGALMDRQVICVEISPQFHALQQEAVKMLDSIAPGATEQVSLVNMPCQLYLPIPNLADHIIFSPPYAKIMRSKGTDKLTLEKTPYDMAEYSQHPLNLGLMNDFLWAEQMEKVYAKCLKTVKPGGTMTVIVKDHYEKQKDGSRKRIQLSKAAWDACMRVGWQPKDWFKWLTLGSVYTRIYRARGWDTVSDEDVLILRRT